jgi:hypothetical protein
MKRTWLQSFTWAVIVETNGRFRQPKGPPPNGAGHRYHGANSSPRREA